VSLTFLSALRTLNTEPSIGAFHQISVHFGKAVSEKIFRNRPAKNKNYLWQPCLLTDQDEMSNLFDSGILRGVVYHNWAVFQLDSFKI
jgi:hypothetical protein